MIYDLSHLEILKIYDILIENNIKPIGVNTDCVLYDIESAKDIDLNNLFDFSNKIGNYKMEYDKYPIKTQINLRNKNELLDLLNTTPIIHEVKDEFNKEEFKNIFDNNNTLVIGCAGSGKSQSLKNYDGGSLFITPFNKLSIENRKAGIESITFHKLMGLAVCETKHEIPKFNITEYETVVFDEIYLYTPYHLSIIDKYIKANGNKKFMATGDIMQLKAFGYSLNNILDMQKYTNECINLIFNNQTK